MVTSFDEMEDAGQDSLWVSFDEGGYEVEDEDESVGYHKKALVGTLVSIKENVGEFDSRMYTVTTEDYEKPLSFWGKGSIDSQIDNVDINPGDDIGILHTGEMGESKNGEFPIFDVRYSSA